MWWHKVIEVGGWAFLALALWSYYTLAVHLPVGSGHNQARGSGHISASVSLCKGTSVHFLTPPTPTPLSPCQYIYPTVPVYI
jgi:hypothetical protein